jgi:hypothetical protein
MVELGFERVDHPRVDRTGTDRVDTEPLPATVFVRPITACFEVT